MPSKIMIRPAILLGAGAAALFLTGAVAIAKPGAQPASPSLARAAERVEAKGFTIMEMDRDHKGFEVEAVASDGRRMKLDVAPDGAILRQRLDH